VNVRWILIVLFVVVFGASTVYAFLKKMADIGLSAVLRSWRERPRLAAVVGAELALLLGVSAGYTSTAGWAAVSWYIAGLLCAGLIILTIKVGSKSAQISKPSAPAQIKYRRPWPPPDPGPPLGPSGAAAAEPPNTAP
jgi:hypothetical protein